MPEGKITIKYLQQYIRSKDHAPQQKKEYFLKLTEEVGELAYAMRKDLRPKDDAQIKETIEEELWDVMYYLIALANCYNIDLERVIPMKEAINNEKYKTGKIFMGDE